MMATLSPNSNADSCLLSPPIPEAEDNIVLKPINVAESNDKMAAHPRFWCGQHSNNNENSKDVYNYGISPSDKSKTPMCQIAELARFYKLKHEYQLMDESGPAHKKLFTVQLVLTPTEVFTGSGASIKKASQSAAAEALKGTALSKPPEKNQKKNKRNGDPSSPCVLLSHVCRRLKMVEPVYTMNSFYPPRGPSGMTVPLPSPSHFPQQPGMMAHYPPLTPKSIIAPPPFPASPLSPTGGNHNGVDTLPLGMCYLLPGGGLKPNRNTLPTLAAPTHMCTIVMASHPAVHAVAGNKQEARCKAATQALILLGPALAMLEQRMKEEKEREGKKREEKENLPSADSSSIEEDGPSEETVKGVDGGAAGAAGAAPAAERPPKLVIEEEEEPPSEPGKRKKKKSVVSQVHECALQMRMTVEFEVISEEGKAHDRSYTVECRLLGGEEVLQARGSGRQKREAKQAACAELIETLKKMESSPLHIATVLYKSQKKGPMQQKEGREPKRKTIVKHMKMDPSYGHQINPVSRLIQVLQARGEPEPVFEFLGEAGQYKYKQFNVQVMVGDLFAEGTGPNKRLAKRAAAEVMLELMGVSKPMPEPGKSLLKRREEDASCAMMSIGVFNPAELLEPSLPQPVEEKKEKEKKEKRSIHWGESEEKEEEEEKRERRRVTFNAQVAACTAPDDVSYPMTEVAPLKADDLGCAGKARRRGREGRTRSLSEQQKLALGRAIVAWKEGKEEKEEDNVFRIESLTAPSTPDGRTPAKAKLEKLGTQFGFNPHYTIFPQGEAGNISSPPSAPSPSSPQSRARTPSPAPAAAASAAAAAAAAGSPSDVDAASPITTSAAYFVIVNIPFTKAIMGEGHGESIDEAHEAAANDALAKISADPNYVPGAVPLSRKQQPQSPQQLQQQQRPAATTPPMQHYGQQPMQQHQPDQSQMQHTQQLQQQQPGLRPNNQMMQPMPNPYYNAAYSGMTSPRQLQQHYGQRPQQHQMQQLQQQPPMSPSRSNPAAGGPPMQQQLHHQQPPMYSNPASYNNPYESVPSLSEYYGSLGLLPGPGPSPTPRTNHNNHFQYGV